ncbi:hypothetical protein RDWZM_008990 [Blomia tropicalis]|uniref:Rad50/SbcC-type AAA domain-containing protein n=1 Tax=Blomia tropicalis TaxID=40697 RepID=A0A9Q0M0J1_BLOTA|nr:hypothetical protein RDWZM_008990 [Blomia tropicalis]
MFRKFLGILPPNRWWFIILHTSLSPRELFDNASFTTVKYSRNTKFQPDEPTEIKFFPLTIFLGPNGAGKTTIIESLKYALTGSLPPNCNNGNSFVHDVQYAKRSMIRGQIRLKFIDTQNKSTVITRNLQSSLKMQNTKPTIKFKQMNAIISQDNNSIDQKAMDVNKEALELTGISRAVLNHIIFCHQEETNWPLSDGKVLKERFDDIFGSIGYVKVLDKIKKTRKQEVDHLKLLEKDVIIFGNQKKEADNRRDQMNKEMIQLDTEKNKVKELEKKIKDINVKLDQFIDMESNAEELMNMISQIEGSIAEKQKLANTIKKTCCKTTLSKTKLEVDDELNNYDFNSKTLISKKEEFIINLSKVENNYDMSVETKQEVAIDIARIEEYTCQLRKLTAERNSLIWKVKNKSSKLDSIIEKLNNRSNLNQKDCDLILEHYRIGIQNCKDELKKKKSDIDTNLISLKQDLDSTKNKKSNAIHECDIWKKQLSETKLNLYEIEKLLSRSSVSESQLSSLDGKIAFYRNTLSKFNDVDDQKFKKNIENLDVKKVELRKDVELLDQKISIINENNEKKLEYNFYKSQKEEKMAKMNEIQEKHSSLYWKVNADVCTFSVKLSEEIDRIEKRNIENQTKLTNLQKEYSTKCTRLDLLKDSLNEFNQQLAEKMKKFNGICEFERFEEFLELKEKEKQKILAEKMNLSNTEPMIESQLSTIKEKEMCPVCENDLVVNWISKKSGNNLNKRSLIAKLEQMKSANPDELKQLDVKFKQAEQLCNDLLRLRNDYDLIISINKKIPFIKTDLEKFQDDTKELKRLIDKETKNISMWSDELKTLKAALPDSHINDTLGMELKDIENNLKRFDSSKWENEDDIDGLTRALKQKRNELRATEQRYIALQKEMMNNTNEKMRIQNSLQTAERNKSEYEKQEQENIGNLKRKGELSSQMVELQNKVIALERQANDCTPQIESLEKQFEAMQNELKQFEREKQIEIDQCENTIVKLTSLFESINSYAEKLNDSKFKSSQKYIEELDKQILELETEKKSIMSEISKMSQDIANLDLKKRELLDYQRYLDLIASISDQEMKLKENHKKMKFMDLATIKRSRISAEKNLTESETKLRTTKERIEEHNQKINLISKELNEYDIAEMKYKEKLIEKVICELACEDLNNEDTIEDTPQTLRCVSDSSEENKSFPDCYQDNDDINEIELYVKYQVVKIQIQ